MENLSLTIFLSLFIQCVWCIRWAVCDAKTMHCYYRESRFGNENLPTLIRQIFDTCRKDVRGKKRNVDSLRTELTTSRYLIERPDPQLAFIHGCHNRAEDSTNTEGAEGQSLNRKIHILEIRHGIGSLEANDIH